MTTSQAISFASTEPLTTMETKWARLIFSLLATAIMAIGLLVLAPSLLNDPDSWWHVRTGLDMLATRTFPTVDVYSYTFAGHTWIAKEWLSQILMALAYKSGAWNGVALLAAAAVLLATFLLSWELSLNLKPTIAFASALILGFLSDGVFTARPHIFTLPIIVLWTASLFRAARADRAPSFLLLALLWVWANLHASFTLGFVIAAFAGLDFFVRNRFKKPSLLVQWCVFGALCPLVSLINPYGLKAILATFTVAYGNEAVPNLIEWQSFSASGDTFHEAVLFLIVFGLIVSGLRISWPRALFALFVLYLYLAHERFMYVFFFLVPLVVAGEIASQFPALSLRTWVLGRHDTLEQFSVRNCRFLAGALVSVLAICAITFVGGRQIDAGARGDGDGGGAPPRY